MTPKEKALELYDKFFDEGAEHGSFDTGHLAKHCAIMAIESVELFIVDKKYWQEVKEEINKL